MAVTQHSSRLALTFVVVSFIFQAGVASLSLKITTVVATRDSSVYAVALTTSIVDLFSVSIVFALALTLQSHSRPQWILYGYIFASFVSIAALGLTIYLLARLYVDRLMLEEDSFFGPALFPAAFAVWAVSLLAHLILYSILFGTYRVHDASQAGEAEKRSTRTGSSHSAKQAAVQLTPMHNALASPSSSTPMILPKHAAHAAAPTSFRNSITSFLRPVTSRTRLINPESIVSIDDISQYSGRESSRDADGFQDWDTTRIAPIKSPSMPQLSKTRLEPIPGSRPVSPAKALDGPFPQDDQPPLSPPIFASHSDLSLPASMRKQASASSLRSPRSRAGSFQQSRRPSTAQSNVHPLFRSESPHPAPIPSPNTVIVASPLAGQVVSPDSTLSGRRTASRPGSLHSSRVQSPLPLEMPQTPPLPQG